MHHDAPHARSFFSRDAYAWIHEETTDSSLLWNLQSAWSSPPRPSDAGKCRAPSQVILAGTQAKQMYKPDRAATDSFYPHCASLSRCQAETRGLASSTNSVLRFAVLPRAHQSLSELSTLSNKTMAFSESLRRLFSRVRCFCHSSCCRRWPASTSRGKEVVCDT